MKRMFEKEEEEEECNHGVCWRRRKLLGEGGFGAVYLAYSKKPISGNRVFPMLMAVKTAPFADSSSLQNEKEIYNNPRDGPYVLQCYGEETTFDRNGLKYYNLLLEHAAGGSLGSFIKLGLPENFVRRYTRCIIEGIYYIHSHGYVHCDLKPENVLLVAHNYNGDHLDCFVPKIADFGLAKKVDKNDGKRRTNDAPIEGTTLYMAPETVVDKIQEFPSDIWALGCIVLEMFTGEKLWNLDGTTEEVEEKIGNRFELPVIPSEISDDGKAFLKACLVKKPEFRFTAEMLLHHPFVSGSDDGR